MKLLTHLVFGCCCTVLCSALSFATVPMQTNLSPEEKQYVLLECENFAEEDSINPEQYLTYIETCVEELSTAVQLAIDELQKNSESANVNNSQDNG